LRQDFFKNYNAFSQNGEIYECGFSGVEEPLKKIEIQYLVLAIFFVVYELELLFFLPFFISVELATAAQLFIIFLVFLIVALSYWYEWEYYLLHFTH
jgi:NADH-quinone oxidoreductase subunit A